MQLDVCKKEYNQGNSFEKRESWEGAGREGNTYLGIRINPLVSTLNNSTTELKVFHPLIIAFGSRRKISEQFSPIKREKRSFLWQLQRKYVCQETEKVTPKQHNWLLTTEFLFVSQVPKHLKRNLSLIERCPG